MEPHTINWWQVLVQAGFTTIPMLIGGYIAYKRLWWILTEHLPHTHVETHGNLTVDGIRYPRTMNGKTRN
jgi:hypothetical protein